VAANAVTSLLLLPSVLYAVLFNSGSVKSYKWRLARKLWELADESKHYLWVFFLSSASWRRGKPG